MNICVKISVPLFPKKVDNELFCSGFEWYRSCNKNFKLPNNRVSPCSIMRRLGNVLSRLVLSFCR